jgi:hypothetical protein
MTDQGQGPGDTELPPQERARIRHRDRKRETRMVVDNAGVRRVIPALKQRQEKRSDEGEAGKA